MRAGTPLPTGAASGMATQPLTPGLAALPDYAAGGVLGGADLSGALGTLPADDPVRALYANLRPPTPMPLPPVNVRPQGWQQRVGATLGASPFHPQINPHASFLESLALSGAASLGNSLAGAGARDYQNAQRQQADAQSGVATTNADAIKAYQSQVEEARKAIASHASELAKAKGLRHPMTAQVFGMLKDAMNPDQQARAMTDGLAPDEVKDVMEQHKALHPTDPLATAEALFKFKQDNAPESGVEDIVSGAYNTDMKGNKYFDTSRVGAKNRDAATAYALSQGITPVSTTQAAALSRIDDAEMNVRNVMSQVKQFAPKDAFGRPVQVLKLKWDQLTQANPVVAGYQANAISAINTLQALAAGAGSGLRINKAEIDRAIASDQPVIGDTIATASQKYANVLAMLEHARAVIVTRDRSTLEGGVNATDANAPKSTAAQHGITGVDLSKEQ